MEQSSEKSKSEKMSGEPVVEIARFLDENRAEAVIVLDIREQTSIADYFVIATATSDGHMHGLYRRLHDLLDEYDLPARQSVKRGELGGWALLDTGSIVIHLMSKEQRDFYELEKLWFDSPVVFSVPPP